MKLSKPQRMQLQLWYSQRHVEKITLKIFLLAQPKIWWVAIILMLSLLIVAELLNFSSYILRSIVIASIFFECSKFMRLKLYWPLNQKFMNWDQVEKILREKNL